MRLFVLTLSVCLGVALGAVRTPKLIRVYPLGGQAGTTVPLEILGERLSNITGVEFDCEDLIWKQTERSGPGKLKGEIQIASSVPLGPHTLRVITLDGPSNSGIFNVGQFRSLIEVEPNDKLERPQPVAAFPIEIQGRLDGAPDIDVFGFDVKQGERWVFDLRSIEDGSAVEARMLLLDATGKRVGFNDDRDDFNENPRIEHTFAAAGRYYVKLDQYRGPRGFNFGKLCSYTLLVSALPVVSSAQPLAVRVGSNAVIRVTGSAMDSVDEVYLTELRQAEYARMTYPYTMPIQFRPDPRSASHVTRLEGRVKSRGTGRLEADLTVPADVRPGIWRVWLVGRHGTSDGFKLEITDYSVLEESAARPVPSTGPITINGALSKPGEKDVYRFDVRAGQPLHFSTMAMQIGVPFLDSVLVLRDGNGLKLAENDDVVAGQGTLLGNPDSSLFFTSKQDGPVFLEVRDRTRRGGPGYEYSLKIKPERPGFQLFTTPENFTVAQGEAAEIKVHLVREAGFEGEVDVWFEGLPEGVRASRGRFRADQLFEPNADGADMIIPDIAFRIEVPETMRSGSYPIQIYGAATKEASDVPKRVVEARATLMLGPLLDVWNYVRRPLPAITMTVVEHCPSALISDVRTLRLERGKSATLELKAEEIPEEAPVRLLDLPQGVEGKVIGRQGSQLTILLQAGTKAPIGTFEIAAEADIGSRRIPSPPIALSIQAVTQGSL